MINKDAFLLEKAYMSISQPMVSVPSDEPEVETAEVVDVAPEAHIEHEEEHCEAAANGCTCGGCPECVAHHEEHECSSEDLDMVISNLDSIRDSLMKIALCCSKGQRLEAWQEQKIAIAMDNMAEVARRCR